MKRSVVSQVRDIVPIRPLTRHESMVLAEQQAQRLLDLLGITEPPVLEDAIAQLARIEVVHKCPWPVSGATQWVKGRWLVVLNGSEPTTRQRFSLAHELKHIIDHPFIDTLYHGIDFTDRPDWIEQVCDYFAGCLLMPRSWLNRAWTNSRHDQRAMANLFQVSQAAMTTRLRQTGLLQTVTRPSRHRYALVPRNSPGYGSRYRRTASAPVSIN
jgi:Zn-dependent peptidase ImmA (M78 family)